MSRSHRTPPPTPLPPHTPPLHRAIDRSEQVKEKVEEAAQDLARVNAALSNDVAANPPSIEVEQALLQSVVVETKVQQAAQELVAVKEALVEEVAERDALELRVSESDSALLESRASEEAARHRALHDAVTELPNATLFADRLETALEQARRHEWRLAVLFLDLDGFKLINDTHGHDIGDRVLQVVAQRLSSFVRGGDSVGRRGGDEFLILMLELQHDAAAIQFATALVDHVAQPCEIDELRVSVGASVGVAVFPDDGTTAETLCKLADSAMYVAKQGRLGVARYEAPTSETGKQS